MRAARILVAPLSLLLLFGADQAAQRVSSRHHEHESAHGLRARQPEVTLLPALRSLLVQLWLIRIDSDLRAGQLHKALRHAREVLAIAPDLPAARVRLSDILAYNLPSFETDEARKLAWIAEGLDVLDSGIERNPYDATLHMNRGVLIWSRGAFYEEFDRAFRDTYGVAPIQEGVDSLVRGAEISRGDWTPVRKATTGLQSRGDWRIAMALEGVEDQLDLARLDFVRAIEFLEELIEFSSFREYPLRIDREVAGISLEIVDLLEQSEQGRLIDQGSLEELLLQRVRLLDEPEDG